METVDNIWTERSGHMTNSKRLGALLDGACGTNIKVLVGEPDSSVMFAELGKVRIGERRQLNGGRVWRGGDLSGRSKERPLQHQLHHVFDVVVLLLLLLTGRAHGEDENLSVREEYTKEEHRKRMILWYRAATLQQGHALTIYYTRQL